MEIPHLVRPSQSFCRHCILLSTLISIISLYQGLQYLSNTASDVILGWSVWAVSFSGRLLCWPHIDCICLAPLGRQLHFELRLGSHTQSRRHRPTTVDTSDQAFSSMSWRTETAVLGPIICDDEVVLQAIYGNQVLREATNDNRCKVRSTLKMKRIRIVVLGCGRIFPQNSPLALWETN